HVSAEPNLVGHRRMLVSFLEADEILEPVGSRRVQERPAGVERVRVDDVAVGNQSLGVAGALVPHRDRDAAFAIDELERRLRTARHAKARVRLLGGGKGRCEASLGRPETLGEAVRWKDPGEARKALAKRYEGRPRGARRRDVRRSFSMRRSDRFTGGVLAVACVLAL